MNTTKIREILRTKGIEVASLASNPVVFERACGVVYKAIPIPFRWIVGKRKVAALMKKLAPAARAK